MPAFSEFIKEQNINYTFAKFDHFKDMSFEKGQRSMSMPPRPSLRPEEIGEVITSQIGGTLGAVGLSGMQESVDMHVQAAVEEVNDIIDGQKKKMKYMLALAKLRRSVRGERRGGRRKVVTPDQPTAKLLNALALLDNVSQHKINNPATEDIGDVIKDDPEYAEHVAAKAVEGLGKSWSDWLVSLFESIWGGIKQIWKFITSNIKFVAATILVIYVAYQAYVTGGITEGLSVIGDQLHGLGQTIMDALSSVGGVAKTWLVDNPVWFGKSVLGQDVELSYFRQKLLDGFYKQKMSALTGGLVQDVKQTAGAIGASGAIGKAITAATTGKAVSTAALVKGASASIIAIATSWMGIALLGFAVVGTGIGKYQLDAEYETMRFDLLQEQRDEHLAYVQKGLDYMPYVASALLTFAAYKMRHIGVVRKFASPENVQWLSNNIGGWLKIAIQAQRNYNKYERAVNRKLANAKSSVIIGATGFIGFDNLSQAMRSDMQNNFFRMDGGIDRLRRKLTTLDGASEDDETERIKTEKALSDVENKKQAMQNMMELKLKQIEEKCKDGSISEADLDSILNKPRDTLRQVTEEQPPRDAFRISLRF